MTMRFLAISLPILALVGCSMGQLEPTSKPRASRSEVDVTPTLKTPGGALTKSKKPEHPSLHSSSPKVGKRIYGTYCASCHGRSARGDGPAAKRLTPPPADLTKHRVGPHVSGKSRWQIIMTGSNGTAMIAFGKVLQPDQLDHLHSYLRQLMHGQSRPGTHANDGAGCPGHGGPGFGERGKNTR